MSAAASAPRSLLVLALLLAGCPQQDTTSYFRVTVSGIPENATILRVSIVQGGSVSTPHDFPLAGKTGPQTFAFVEETSRGYWLQLGIAALDDAANHCTLAWQTSSGDGRLASGVISDVSVELVPADPATCTHARTPGMLLVPAGKYTLGCDPLIDSDCRSWESPPRPVSLAAFEIDATEVTVGDYQNCMLQGVCGMPVDNDDTFATVNARTWISWDLADAFCKARGKTLPTEAQWEAAARGTSARLYPWGNVPPSCVLANYDNHDTTHPCSNSLPDANGATLEYQVGARPDGRSEFGVLDMAGNVEEWVADWYAARSELSVVETANGGPATGTERVLKGGNEFSATTELRGAARASLDPSGDYTLSSGTVLHGDINLWAVGFRCVRPLADAAP